MKKHRENIKVKLDFKKTKLSDLQLTSKPFETEIDVTDDYGHTFPSHQRVIRGHYLEQFKEVKEGEIFYLETKMMAYVSSLCVAGVCPELVKVTRKQKGKEEKCFW